MAGDNSIASLRPPGKGVASSRLPARPETPPAKEPIIHGNGQSARTVPAKPTKASRPAAWTRVVPGQTPRPFRPYWRGFVRGGTVRAARNGSAAQWNTTTYPEPRVIWAAPEELPRLPSEIDSARRRLLFLIPQDKKPSSSAERRESPACGRMLANTRWRSSGTGRMVSGMLRHRHRRGMIGDGPVLPAFQFGHGQVCACEQV